MSDSKRVLSCMPKVTLLELSQTFGFKGWHVLNKGEIVDRLAGDRSIPLEDLLTTLKIPPLKNICQDLGIDIRGSKEDLVGRILSEVESPPPVTSPKPPKKEPQVSSNGNDIEIIMTTGQFSTDAKKEARRDRVPPIELVNGENMVDMFEHLELGLKPIKTYEIDDKFFDEFKN